MDKNQQLPPIPALSRERLEHLERVEREIKKQLDGCDGFSFNVSRALRVVRSEAVPAILVQVEYYESIPGYDPRWIQQVVEEAIDSILDLAPPSGMGYRDQLRNEMLRAWDGAQQDRNQKPARLPSTVNSLTAAKRMERFIADSPLTQTQFATNAGTTDRTLRNFRKTGKIRLSIFQNIAREMGISPKDLLSRTGK